MIVLLLQAPPPQIQIQMGTASLPAQMQALIQAEAWGKLADWFEKASPATRVKYYEWWLQSLNRTARWKRLLSACDAVQPKVEGKTGPRLGTYRLYRAQALSQLGRHVEAAHAHAENGKLGYPDGLPNACEEARLAQDWKSLLAYSEALLKQKADDPAGLAWKGEALSRLGRLAEAEPVLRATVAKSPKDAYAWNNLGRCLNAKKAWSEACEAFDRALALQPDQLEARFNRGVSRFELKRYADSREDFQAALALRPGDLTITRNLREAEKALAITAANPH